MDYDSEAGPGMQRPCNAPCLRQPKPSLIQSSEMSFFYRF